MSGVYMKCYIMLKWVNLLRYSPDRASSVKSPNLMFFRCKITAASLNPCSAKPTKW